MSRKADCYDNATMEAFWSSLKNELIYPQALSPRTRTVNSLFQYIEIYYNRHRLHSSLATSHLRSLNGVASHEPKLENPESCDKLL